MSRRSNNSGSVVQRSDGKWAATVRLNGKRWWRYAATRQEANRKLQDLIRQHHLGRLNQPTRTTLSEWITDWLALNEPVLRPSAFRTYRQVLEPIIPLVGQHRLDRLTPLVLADAFATLLRQGRGARRLQLAHGYLKACLDRAVDLDMLHTNPMGKVPRPKWQPRERRYWTIEESQRFLSVAAEAPSKWSPLFIILLTCGLRLSEALGLTWQDIDLRKKSLKVERAMVWAGNNHVLGPVKTKAGRRIISLPETAVLALHRLPQPMDESQPVFRTSMGKAPSPGHLRDPFFDLIRLADVPKINIHGLRHTAAALAFRATGDPYAVQRRLGHAHVSITIGIYGYGTRDDHEVAESLERLLDGGASQEKTQSE